MQEKHSEVAMIPTFSALRRRKETKDRITRQLLEESHQTDQQDAGKSKKLILGTYVARYTIGGVDDRKRELVG